jgi:hypothetical protein
MFITSSLEKLKTASSRQGFNEVIDRFFHHLIHHHCHLVDNDTECEEEAAAVQERMFFISCLQHFSSLSVATRCMLAQVLSHCGFHLSSPGMITALLSLLATHPQKAVFDSLSEFLSSWVIESARLENTKSGDTDTDADAVTRAVVIGKYVIKWCTGSQEEYHFHCCFYYFYH